MAKFTWTIESDDPKEAVRINEEMATLAYRIGKNKQASKVTRERATPDEEIELTNPVTGKGFAAKLTPGAVRDSVDTLIGWITQAKNAGELKQVVTANSEMIKANLSASQQKRIGSAIERRETDLISAERLDIAKPEATNDDPAPSQETLAKEFKMLFDAHGAEPCQEILKQFKVDQMKNLPKGLWASALAAIRSSMAVNSIRRP